jgi:hypothetical protein
MRFIRRFVMAASYVLVFLSLAQAQLVTGACGSSNGASLTSSPTANLCSSGTASTVSGSGPWSWSCFGNGRGTTATCSALKLASAQGVSGACGSSNGASLTTAPTANLCATGAGSTVTGSGPWYWNCAGSNGGATVSCSASLKTASSGSASDPTVDLLPRASDGWANWKVAGMNAIPLTGSISGTTLTVTATPSSALGPSQTISGSGIASGTQITAFGTGTGGRGTYSVNTSQTVTSEAMTASGIPNRTKIYTTLSPNGKDDTAQVNTALSNCPAGQVIQLTAGVFHITGNGLAISVSSCTLRGAGPGQLLNTGLNRVDGGGTVRSCASGSLVTYGGDSFCTDSTATQLVKSDRATNTNYGVLYVHPNNLWVSNSYNLASDAVQGAYSVTLSSVPSDVHVGDIVDVDEEADNDANVYWGNNDPPGGGSRTWFSFKNRPSRTLTQILEVSAVNGATITFDTPLTYPYHTSSSSCTGCDAQLSTVTSSFLHGVGIENLFVWGGMGGDGNANLPIYDCAYCWVKNVESAWSGGSSIGLYEDFRNVVRDNYVHETPGPRPGGGGYLFNASGGSSENLIENNIFWYGNKVDVMRASGGGNVFAYNYTDDSFGDQYPDSMEDGINAGHYTTPHLELLEGNYSSNFDGDSFWGGSIFITGFRNWLSQHRAAHPPLNTYTYTDSCGVHLYGDYNGSARAAVNIQAYNYYSSLIGNVLGTSGQVLLGAEACLGAQSAFVTQVTTTTQWNAMNNNNQVPEWQMGTLQPGGWTFVATTVNTQTRTANWDWYTRAIHCYGTGGTTDLGCTGVTVPNSFYLTSKPVFFGSQTWPWVNPTTGTTYTLPAKYCFEHSEMPTCLQ